MTDLTAGIRTSVCTFGDAVSDTTIDEVQDALVAELLTLSETDYPCPLAKIHLSKENAKWRALSSLQKAIRRGHEENALKMVSALINSGEEEHVLKRLCTIALEDVAFGDPGLCGMVFAFAASQKIRAKTGGWPTLLALTKLLAVAHKDRIPCEIAVSAGYSPEDDAYKKAMYARTTAELTAMAHDWQAHHWQDVQTATRFLSGHMKMDGEYLNAHRAMTAFRATFSDCPPLIRYIAHRSAAGGGESAALVSGMRLGWHLLYHHPEADPITLSDELDPPGKVVKSILLEALDMHTQEGKQAFRTLLKAEGKDFAKWVKAAGGDPLEALGNAIFMVEGKVCNRRLTSPDIHRISHLSHEAQMGRAGLPKDQLHKLCTEVTTLIPALNVHREQVLLA